MIRRYLPIALTLYIAFVFIQSLFFKFSNSPETQYIFGTLEVWGFARTTGLVRPIRHILAICGRHRRTDCLGLAAGGAVSAVTHFASGWGLDGDRGDLRCHILSPFTPLGVSVLNTDGTHDGGELFALACGVWVAAALLLWLSKDTIGQMALRLRGRG